MQAWHKLTPENSNRTNGEQYGEDVPKIPDKYCYLPEFMYKIGVAGQGINGLVPLTFQEIEAWSRMKGAELTGFEAETIRTMSEAYCAIANDRASDCPIQDGEIHEAIQDTNIASWIAAARK